MLKKYSIFMMLLLGTGSLIGISSIYKPVNVETQPQPLIKEPSTQIPGAGQFLADKFLVDRIFPQIVAKLDGKTLLQKIDGKLLAQKVFPYLDLNVAAIERPGQISNIDITGPLAGKTSLVKASCAPEESLVGGAMQVHNMGELHGFHRSQQPAEPNSWVIITSFDGDGRIASFAECLRVELALKDVQQPQQQPSPPPGGPPLQPPPNLK